MTLNDLILTCSDEMLKLPRDLDQLKNWKIRNLGKNSPLFLAMEKTRVDLNPQAENVFVVLVSLRNNMENMCKLTELMLKTSLRDRNYDLT